MYVVLGSDPPSHLDFQSHYPPSHDIFQHALCRGSVDFVQKNSLEFILPRNHFNHTTDFHFTNYSFSFPKFQILQKTDQCSSLFFQVGSHVDHLEGSPRPLANFFLRYI